MSESNLYELRILKGEDAGARLALSGSRLTLGSGENCDVVLHDATLAEEHLQAVFAEGVLTLLSAHGDGAPALWVNGAPPAQLPQDVRAGDVVQIGETMLAIGRDQDTWANPDELVLARPTQDGARRWRLRLSTKQLRSVALTMGLGGALGLASLVGLVIRQGEEMVFGGGGAAHSARAELDLALRSAAAYRFVSLRAGDGTGNGTRARASLIGLVAGADDFARLEKLANQAQLDFQVENGARLALAVEQRLTSWANIAVRADLKTQGRIHLTVMGLTDDAEGLRADARAAANAVSKSRSLPELTLSFMLSDYTAARAALQDALDEETGFDTLELHREQDGFLLAGALLQTYDEKLQSVLQTTLASFPAPPTITQNIVRVPPPKASILGFSKKPPRVRYRDVAGKTKTAGVGAQLTENLRIVKLYTDAVLLQAGTTEVIWPQEGAPRQRVAIEVLERGLKQALTTNPVFAELKLQRKGEQLILSGGISASGEARLRALLREQSWSARARHRILLRITAVPAPDGELITILDGAAKAVRLRAADGSERLVYLGEPLGNGLRLAAIINGTAQVQFGSVTARLEVR